MEALSVTLSAFFFKAKRSLMLTQKETTEMTTIMDTGRYGTGRLPAHRPLSGSREEQVGTEASAGPRAWAWHEEQPRCPLPPAVGGQAASASLSRTVRWEHLLGSGGVMAPPP